MATLIHDFHKSDIYRFFFDAVIYGGIEPIVQAAHNLLGYPIIVNNETGDTLLQCPNQKRGDPDWDYSYEYKSIQHEHYHILHSNYISKPELHNKPLVVNQGFLDKRNQVIIVVSHRHQIMAMISIILDDHEVTDAELEVIQVFISAIRAELQRMQSRRRSEAHRLKTVLTETDRDSLDYRTGISALKKLYKGNYQLILAVPKYNEEQNVLDTICTDLNEHFDEMLATSINNMLVVLLYGLTQTSSNCYDILNFFAHYPVSCSVSTTFANIETISNYFFQANMTLNAGRISNPDDTLYYFDDYLPFQIYAAASVFGDLNVFIHPVIRQINMYDMQNGTNYLHTIDIYLQCRKNKTLTTKELFIHLNTLTYRLNKISELFHIDLDDFAYVENFYSSLMLWKFLNKQR